MRIYNTLSRKKEEFKPLSETVKMYSCGPTVYSYAHIGNMRAYIFMDCVVRALKYCGYNVTSMINITDVGHLVSDSDEGEDKMQKASREQNKSPYEIAKIYTDAFMRDLRQLNVTAPKIIEKATDHINDMIEFVKTLVEKGYGYETDDGIYFDIQKFPAYGKLSGQKLSGQIAGARVEINEQKRHPADFALWKKAPKEHIMQWQSPWGMGYPGWHIECSALSRKFLGARFDIHTGGVDHIPVHHENEIAQSEALEGGECVNYWLHGEFMQVNGGKMSKSLGNVYTVSDLANKGYSPMAFRYFCLNTHYRKALNFTFDALDGAQKAYDRMINLLSAHKNAPIAPASTHSDEVASDEVAKAKKEFTEAISDDMNYPLGLGVLWELIKQPLNREIYNAALVFDSALGLNIEKAVDALRADGANKQEDIPQNVLDLCAKRQQARLNKEWALSDSLRKEIAALGYTVADTKDGFSVSPLRA